LKILVKRYPDLQKHQVSCHAAHKEGDKMMPCGNCEKCRRIVGMLMALDEDPKRCGYSDAQIDKSLKALGTKKVKQLGSDAQHLYYLLVSKGLITVGEELKKMVKSNPEIMALRMDNERSMMEDLPVYIRQPLFEIFQAYADGMVKLEARKWISHSLSEKETTLPYFLNKK
jgi:hypothetical protein